MIRISTTTIEQFRKIFATEYVTEQSVADSIRGVFTPTWQMESGSAWGRALETNTAKVGAYTFNPEAIQAAREHIGSGLWEVKTTADLCGARIVAKVDHIWGNFIQDNKARFGQVDLSQYEQDLQWRFYLESFEVDEFRYNCFDLAEPKDGYIKMHGIESVRFWRYPGLRADCERWVREFLTWAGDRHLLRHLERTGSSPEVPR